MVPNSMLRYQVRGDSPGGGTGSAASGTERRGDLVPSMGPLISQRNNSSAYSGGRLGRRPFNGAADFSAEQRR